MEPLPAEIPPAAAGPPSAGSKAPPAPEPKHVAVVYFHGMGSQRHYEDVCQLVDRLDRAAHRLGRTPGSGFEGLRLVDRTARVERVHDPAAANRGDDMVYVRARAAFEQNAQPAVSLRFYEAYWAPETVDGTNAAAVATWLVRQARKPLQLLLGPWREFHRLRRATLVALYQSDRDRFGDPAGHLHDRTARLVGLYEQFQLPGARARFPRGSFREFRSFIAGEVKDQENAAATTAALEGLARRWHADHVRREWLHLAGIGTVMAGGLGLIFILVILAVWLLSLARGVLPSWLPLPGSGAFKPTPELIATIVSFLLSALGIKRFLEDFVGDVQQYATYEETDRLYQRRKAVLDKATGVLRHALESPGCERVVVVAHSLGSVVAVDALLGLWRYNRAAGSPDPLAAPLPLHKIEHLFTYGSPVDKVNYFFAVTKSPSGTYEQLIEDLRGDIGTPPFSKVGRQPHIHWINFWDKGDAISGPTETVASSHLRTQAVDNVRIATYTLPDLAGSHGAYIDRPAILQDLLSAIVFRRFNYVDPPRDAQGKPDFDALRRGPGTGSGAQTAWFTLVFVLPWLLLLACFEITFHWGSVVRWALAAVVVVQIAALLAHRRRT